MAPQHDAPDVEPGVPILTVRPSWRALIRYLLLLLLLAVVIGLLFAYRGWIEEDALGGFSAWLHRNPLAVHIVAYVSMAIAAWILLRKVLFRRLSLKLTLYPDRVTLEKGILSKDIKVIFCADIRTIEVRKSLMQRILRVGDLLIATAGTEGYEDEASGLAYPIRLKNRILELKRLAHKSDD